ncbi:MAG: hypothetical protein ACREN5_14015 [Gemmatimonadales bacterium]
MPSSLWARLQADIDVNLRRGAWYRVLEVRGHEVVLAVRREPVTVLKALLEITSRPPLQWTVVMPPRGKRALPAELASGYAVCPLCRGRAPLPKKSLLPKRAKTLRCPHCREEFALDASA